jgi:hypothetical protein
LLKKPFCHSSSYRKDISVTERPRHQLYTIGKEEENSHQFDSDTCLSGAAETLELRTQFLQRFLGFRQTEHGGGTEQSHV